jgi:hypothetical protein
MKNYNILAIIILLSIFIENQAYSLKNENHSFETQKENPMTKRRNMSKLKKTYLNLIILFYNITSF